MIPVSLKKPGFIILCLFIFSFIMHFRVFKLDLIGYHIWRQVQTQTVINNFARDGIDLLNPRINNHAYPDRILRLEFPVMQLFFSLVYRICGDHIMITRILSFFIGVLTVFGIYLIIKSISGNSLMGAIGAWAFNFSPLFYYYTMNPLPDNFALCCGTWSTVFFLKWSKNKSILNIVASACLLAIGVLAKLPFILFGLPALVFLFSRWDMQSRKISIDKIIAQLFFLLAVIPAIIWYSYVIPSWKWQGLIYGLFVTENTLIQTMHYIWFNLVSALPELMTNYASFPFLLSGFYFLFKNKTYKNDYFHSLFAWGSGTILYFLYEINVIARIHDYYLLPFLPLIFILVAHGAYNLLASDIRFIKYFSIALLILLPLTAYLRINHRWDPEKPGMNKDFYFYREELRKLIPGNDLCVAGNDESMVILLYYIDKNGWTFDSDNLPGETLSGYILQGAKYLYSDSRVDTVKELQPYINEKIYEAGSIKVYRLNTATNKNKIQ